MNAVLKQVGDGLFLGALKTSDLGRKVLESAAKEAAKHRKALADALEARTAENSKVAPRLVADTEAAWAEVVKAEEALAAARARHATACLARSSEAADFRQSRDALETELAETADPAIDDFIRELRMDQDRTRKLAHAHHEMVRNPITGRGQAVMASNVASVRARLSAASAAIESAVALKLLPDQSGVSLALAALRDGLPPIETPTTGDEK